jgi:Trypsin-like peptidase domain/Colicin V production protein
VTSLDWIIVAFTVLMAAWGYAQGLIVGALSLAGFAAGAFFGSRLGPMLLEEGSRSPYAPLSALVGAILVGGLLASLAEMLGFHFRHRLGERLGLLDGVGGAALVACLGLFLVWVGGAVALNTPGANELREPIQRSKILRELNAALPPSGPLIQALARFDPFPRIDGPEADVPPPTSRIARDPDVRRAYGSVVKVLGTACGLGVAGSGGVAGDGLVVTNAHVVAGERDTTVLLGGREPGRRGHAVHFDPRNDIAILRVPGLRARPLALAGKIDSGTSAAILGFPLNGPFDVRPGRIGDTRRVRSSDAYGRGPVERSMTALRGLVRPGNSGGPMVDGEGRVVTTVFAATTRGPRGGYGVPNTVVRRALSDAGGPVSTGPCSR